MTWTLPRRLLGLPSPGRRRRVRPGVEPLEERRALDAKYYPLAAYDYWQDWSDTKQIVGDDDWSGVLSVTGYRGDGITSSEGTDPRNVTRFAGIGGPVVHVLADRCDPDTLTAGGVAEFHLKDPVVALQGSATARAPFLLFHFDTTGVRNIALYLELRDLDGSGDDAQSQVAVQYRVGAGAKFRNVPKGYVEDASTGPFKAGAVTPLYVTLPADVDNQAQVQVRVLTTDAVGGDEWIGVDNVYVTSTPKPPANDALRIVSYNIATPTGTPRAGLQTLLQGIGEETVQGHARPLDVLALQEVQNQATTTEFVVSLLNGVYSADVYARGFLNGATTGSGTQGIVYNTYTVQLLGEAAVGIASTTGQPRQALRYHLRPAGTDGSADFFLYNSHFKADSDSTSQNRRLIEANALRADADALGKGTHVFFVGDFNTYTSFEAGYQRLLSAGNGQAFDPINRPGSWHTSPAFVDIFTQAPTNTPPPGLAGGGVDDRFDFQLATGALFDSYGLDYRFGSYHTFGVNGSVPVNGNVNDPRSTALPDLSNRLTLLDLLTTVSDHLPVVADYLVGLGVRPRGVLAVSDKLPPADGVSLVAALELSRQRPTRDDAENQFGRAAAVHSGCDFGAQPTGRALQPVDDFLDAACRSRFPQADGHEEPARMGRGFHRLHFEVAEGVVGAFAGEQAV